MIITNRRENLFLFVGDLLAFCLAIWLMLLLRYGRMPAWPLISHHLAAFSFLFAVWILVFFIAGLYEKQTLILKSKLPNIILRSQIVNSILAVIFFYYIPYFGITPKINLFIYLLLSFILILLWRTYNSFLLGSRRRENAIIVGSGSEMKELVREVNLNTRYNLQFISSIDLESIEGIDFQSEIIERVYAEEVSVIAIDLKSNKVLPILPHFYNLIFSKVRFIDMYKIYEDIFDRVPLSLVTYSWFLEHISLSPKFSYDILKRVMDIVVALVGGLISLILYPFIYLAIKLDDRGPIFIMQERIGKNNKLVRTYKFRSMQRNETNLAAGTDNVVTRVGAFLRKSRIDELPQLWSVVRGDMSLIGPRPELPSGVTLYEKEIPYYNIRHLIKPGLSGWAQIYHDNHPHHAVAVDATKEKLSYDLYYIKNRSLMLDLKIALRTLKVLISRSGI